MARSALTRYRILFSVAATYNFVFAFFSGVFPRRFYGWFGIALQDLPVPWYAVSIVVGAFGLLYVYAACRPQSGDVAVLIGLASKVLGPLAWLAGVANEQMPIQMFSLLLIGDLAWWFPFLFYLLRTARWQRTAMAWISVGLHLLACLALLAAAPGTESNEDIVDRQIWIQNHQLIWISTWLVWSLASMSLLALCVAWIHRLHELIYANWLTVLPVTLIVIGLGCDLYGEHTLIVQATADDLSMDEFIQAISLYQRMSPGLANGLYCLGGLMLSGVSWRIGWLRGTGGTVGLIMWIIGLGLTMATLMDQRVAMMVSGAGVMLLFMPWAAMVGWRLRPAA